MDAMSSPGRARPRPLADRPLEQPHAARLDRSHPLADAALAAHGAALQTGEATHVDPISGYLVLTARTLAERGTCCGLGCRHCPYVQGRSSPCVTWPTGDSVRG